MIPFPPRSTTCLKTWFMCCTPVHSTTSTNITCVSLLWCWDTACCVCWCCCACCNISLIAPCLSKYGRCLMLWSGASHTTNFTFCQCLSSIFFSFLSCNNHTRSSSSSFAPSYPLHSTPSRYVCDGSNCWNQGGGITRWEWLCCGCCCCCWCRCRCRWRDIENPVPVQMARTPSYFSVIILKKKNN